MAYNIYNPFAQHKCYFWTCTVCGEQTQHIWQYR